MTNRRLQIPNDAKDTDPSPSWRGDQVAELLWHLANWGICPREHVVCGEGKRVRGPRR
jgi:hypothetical protein